MHRIYFFYNMKRPESTERCADSWCGGRGEGSGLLPRRLGSGLHKQFPLKSVGTSALIFGLSAVPLPTCPGHPLCC